MPGFQPQDDTRLMTVETQNLLRINKSVHPVYYSVFIDELESNTSLNTEVRKRILARWAKITPKIPLASLRQYLFSVEQRYWASIPSWEQTALTNKIINQTMNMQEKIEASTDRQETSHLVKKNGAIVKGNELIAKVARLIEQAPQATFSININNLDEDQMAAEMNELQSNSDEDSTNPQNAIDVETKDVAE